MDNESSPVLEVRPIGYVRTASRFKFDAPNQPRSDSEETNYIELNEGMQFELALQDLDGFDFIWVVSWFDRNQHWRPRVLPPRGPSTRRGVFATRSPHRPNPIGLTSVRLIRIDGLRLEVGPLDLTDGTPILDIKPYLRTVDSHPESSLGWVETIEAFENQPPTYDIQITEKAQEQLDWLRIKWNVDFLKRASDILGRDPSPHRTRRILQLEPNRFRIACGAWRVYYHLADKVVVIEEVNKGYSDENLQMPGREKILDREAQISFATWSRQMWPTGAN